MASGQNSITVIGESVMDVDVSFDVRPSAVPFEGGLIQSQH
jgi:hypothetical protein